MNHRNLTVDIAKGIGIILVVFGHNWIVKHEPGELFRIIFSFHVPLFFFMSGFFIKPSDGLKEFIFRRADTLLKPYLTILLLVGVLKIFNPFSTEKTSFWRYLLGVLYASGPTIEGVSLWFLPHLFVASIVAMTVLHLINLHLIKVWASRDLWLWGISGLFLILGIPFISLFWHRDTHGSNFLDQMFFSTHELPGLPFSLDLILISSALILLGFLLRKKVQIMTFNLSFFSIGLLSFFLLHLEFNETIDLNMRLYSHPLISTLQAILGIYLTLLTSAGLQRYPMISRPLISIGSGSLFILIFHTFIQEKVFFGLLSFTHATYFSALVSLGAALWGPLFILKMVKRQRSLALLFLPRKSRAA
jgi:polysaccharide biosynthesis protein PslL